MKLRTLFVDFEAQLSIDMDDVEVLGLLSRGGCPIAKWLIETYHIDSRFTKEKIEKTLKNIGLVMTDVLERRKALLEVETTSK